MDLSRFFAGTQEELAERTALRKEVGDWASAMRARAGDTSTLAADLHRGEQLLSQLYRHATYLKLRSSLDRTERSAVEAHEEVEGLMNELAEAADTRLRLTPSFSGALPENPGLRRYAFLYQEALRDAPHVLPASGEAIATQLATPALDGFYEVYEQLLKATPFPTVHTSRGPLDARSALRDPEVQANANLRSEASRKRLEGFSSMANVYATLLFDIIRERNVAARLHGFPDAPSQTYFGGFLRRSEVDARIAGVERRAQLLQEYERVRVRRVLSATGRRDVGPWDLEAALPGESLPRFTLEQARSAILEALAPLGSGYVAHFRDLLEPARGRAEVSPGGPNQYEGGYSQGAPGVDSVLYVGRYTGSLEDLRVIIHEGGHAVHMQMMSEAEVSPFYASGPRWLAEGLAIFNQLLLHDYLYRTAREPQLREGALEAFIEDITFEVFTSAEEARLEQGLYDGVAAGRIRDASEVDNLTLKVLGEYEIWPARYPELKHVWMTKRLMFEDPLYLVNYLFAGLLASQLFTLAERNPADFAKRYEMLLREGFSAPPATLLERAFGADFTGERAVQSVAELLDRKVDELKRLYKGNPVGRGQP